MVSKILWVGIVGMPQNKMGHTQQFSRSVHVEFTLGLNYIFLE